MVAYSLSVFVQLASLALVPVYLYGHDCSAVTCVYFAVAAACLSLAWLPHLHNAMRVSATTPGPPRPVYKPAADPSARVFAYLYNAAARIAFTLVYFGTVAAHHDVVTWAAIPDALRHVGSSEGGSVWPLAAQLVVSFAAYHAARLACVLSVHRYAYALPLFLTFPVAMALAVLWPAMPYITWVRWLSCGCLWFVI